MSKGRGSYHVAKTIANLCDPGSSVGNKPTDPVWLSFSAHLVFRTPLLDIANKMFTSLDVKFKIITYQEQREVISNRATKWRGGFRLKFLDSL